MPHGAQGHRLLGHVALGAGGEHGAAEPLLRDWFNGAAPPEALYQDLTRPLFVVVIAGCGILILTCVLGYLVNLCRGARGTDAIPYYNWAMSTLSISDYQLKPNPRPQGM